MYHKTQPKLKESIDHRMTNRNFDLAPLSTKVIKPTNNPRSKYEHIKAFNVIEEELNS